MINNFAEMNPEFRIWFRPLNPFLYSFALSTTSWRARAIADVMEGRHGRTLAVVPPWRAQFLKSSRAALPIFSKATQKQSNGNPLARKNNFVFIRKFNEMSARRHKILLRNSGRKRLDPEKNFYLTNPRRSLL